MKKQFNQLIRKFSTSNSCSKPSFHRGFDAWQVVIQNKPAIGARTIIVTGDDSASKHLAQRMWFETQKNGIQSGFFTVKTAFPTAATVQEGVEMVRRTGAKSVLSIGNGAVGDVAKGIRSLIESGAKTVAEHDVMASRGASTAATHDVTFPHISISTTLTPMSPLPGWVCLHHEEDVFTRRACKEPEVVVHDPQLVAADTAYLPAATSAYILSGLFDVLFIEILKLTVQRSSQQHQLFDVTTAANHLVDVITKDTGIMEELKALTVVLQQMSENSNSPSAEDLCKLTTVVSQMRHTISKPSSLNPIPNPKDGVVSSSSVTATATTAGVAATTTTATDSDTDDPLSVLETVSLLSCARSKLLSKSSAGNKRVSVPYSWIQAVVFNKSLEILETYDEPQSVSDSAGITDEELVKASAAAAANTLSTVLNIQRSDLTAWALKSCESVLKAVDNLKKKSGSGSGNNSRGGSHSPSPISDGLSAAGLLEAWIMCEETSLEKANNAARGPTNNILKSVAAEEERERGSKAVSPSLVMLRSDFILDCTEGVFNDLELL